MVAVVVRLAVSVMDGDGESVGVVLAVGVIVAKRTPLPATIVAKVGSVVAPYGMTSAVLVGVCVWVPVAVAVADAVGVVVRIWTPLPAASVAKAGSMTVPCGTMMGVCDAVGVRVSLGVSVMDGVGVSDA